MEFRYHISEEDYINILEDQFKQRRTGILNIFLFILMTVGQSAYAVWYIITAHPKTKIVVCIAFLSISISIIQIFYQHAIRLRAVQTLKTQKKRKAISEDFWKLQVLTLENDILTLRCGKEKLSYDCAYYIKAETVGDALVLTFKRGKNIQQIILPIRVFQTENEKEEFISKLQVSRQNSILAGMSEINEIVEENYEYSVQYSMTKKQFADALVQCTRKYYVTRAGLSLKNIARIAGTVFLLGNVIMGKINTGPFILFAVLVSFLLMIPYISAFSPIQSAFARQNAENIFRGLDTMDFQLAVFTDRIAWRGDSFLNEIPIEKLIAAEKTNNIAFLFFNNNSSVFVPITENNKMEITRCWLYLDTVSKHNSSIFKKKA